MEPDMSKQPLLKRTKAYGSVPAPTHHFEQQQQQQQQRQGSDQVEAVPIFVSYRLLVTVLCQLGLICSFASQSMLGASLLSMVRQNNTNSNATGVQVPLGVWQLGAAARRGPDPSDSEWTYPWDSYTLGWILAAFFMGYYVMQIPAALLTNRLGGKMVLLYGAIVLALLQGLAICTPRFGAKYFIITIVLAGIANGCLYVPLMDVLAQWVPPHESSVLVSLAVAGIGIGTAALYGLSAITSHVNLWGGWPLNFIALGVLLLFLALLFGVLVTDKPSTNRFISSRELAYIQWSMRQQRINQGSESSQCKVIPWLQVMKSLPMYAIAASQFGQDWIQYFFITLFPYYLMCARGMEVSKVSMLSGIPWLGFPVAGYLASRMVDYLRRKNITTTTLLRKIVDFFAKMVPMGLLVVIMFLPYPEDSNNNGQGNHTHSPHHLVEQLEQLEDQDVLRPTPVEQTAVLAVLYVLAVCLMGLAGSSWLANIVDLSPEFAGVVSGVCQMISLPGAFFMPLLVEALTPHNTADEWQKCSLVMLAIVSASYLVYILLGSSEHQAWGIPSAGHCPQAGCSDSPLEPPAVNGNEADDENDDDDDVDDGYDDDTNEDSRGELCNV